MKLPVYLVTLLAIPLMKLPGYIVTLLAILLMKLPGNIVTLLAIPPMKLPGNIVTLLTIPLTPGRFAFKTFLCTRGLCTVKKHIFIINLVV